MNLPNRLTLSRLVMTAIFLVVLFWHGPFCHTMALVLFIAASLTDYWDGHIARRDGLITTFGILMDPLADKILICSAFIAFVGSGLIPAWIVVIVVARELAITGLRLLAATKQAVLAAERYGKHKTVSQMAAVITLLVAQSYPEWSHWALPVFRQWAAWASLLTQWIAVLLTFTSGTLYLWRNRTFYLDDL